MNDNYTKKCDYCKDFVSVFESITEFGKHYHHRCMVHKLNLELEGYKKKYLDGKMTSGDKAIFLDKFKLSRDLMNETTEFHGWEIIEERKSKKVNKEKTMLVDAQFQPILKDGKPQYIDAEYSNEMTVAVMRPDVRKNTIMPIRKSLKPGEILRLKDIPRLMKEI